MRFKGTINWNKYQSKTKKNQVQKQIFRFFYSKGKYTFCFTINHEHG